MKQGKRLTIEMKKMLAAYGFDYNDYLYIKNTTHTVEFVHRRTGKTLLIEKMKN